MMDSVLWGTAAVVLLLAGYVALVAHGQKHDECINDYVMNYFDRRRAERDDA